MSKKEKEVKTPKTNKNAKNGVRTKTVFGKPLGKTNLFIFLFVALAIVGLSYWIVTSTVQKDIDKYEKETSNLKTKINQLKNTVYEELIDTSVFMAALPESINPEEVTDQIVNSARTAGLDVLAPNLPISYSADATLPTSLTEYGLTASVKSYCFTVSIVAEDMDTVLAFLDNIYGTGGVSSRIFYVEAQNITGISSDSIMAAFSIYTFYRVEPTTK